VTKEFCEVQDDTNLFVMKNNGTNNTDKEHSVEESNNRRYQLKCQILETAVIKRRITK
jgi:hypothetical protein